MKIISLGHTGEKPRFQVIASEEELLRILNSLVKTDPTDPMVGEIHDHIVPPQSVRYERSIKDG